MNRYRPYGPLAAPQGRDPLPFWRLPMPVPEVRYPASLPPGAGYVPSVWQGYPSASMPLPSVALGRRLRPKDARLFNRALQGSVPVHGIYDQGQQIYDEMVTNGLLDPDADLLDDDDDDLSEIPMISGSRQVAEDVSREVAMLRASGLNDDDIESLFGAESALYREAMGATDPAETDSRLKRLFQRDPERSTRITRAADRLDALSDRLREVQTRLDVRAASPRAPIVTITPPSANPPPSSGLSTAGMVAATAGLLAVGMGLGYAVSRRNG